VKVQILPYNLTGEVYLTPSTGGWTAAEVEVGDPRIDLCAFLTEHGFHCPLPSLLAVRHGTPIYRAMCANYEDRGAGFTAFSVYDLPRQTAFPIRYLAPMGVDGGITETLWIR
jgi:hypothetical protein